MQSELEISVNQITAQRTFAVGNDLVHIENFKLSLSDLFKKKVYTPAEIAYCESFSDSLQRYASTWAAKEAVYKAIKQLDSSPLGWKKIEIKKFKNIDANMIQVKSEAIDIRNLVTWEQVIIDIIKIYKTRRLFI